MRFVVTHLACLALVWHLVLGCCAHHQHCRAFAEEPSCAHHHGHAAHDHDHDAPATSGEQRDHDASAPDSVPHSDCHESHCFALAVSAAPSQPSPWTILALDCLPALPLEPAGDFPGASLAVCASGPGLYSLSAAARSPVLLN